MKKLMLAGVLALGLQLASSGASASAREAGSPQPAAATAVSIPVLLYHVVTDNPSGRYQLSLSKFREQMNYLAANGYTALSVAQYYSIMTLQSPAPSRPILLTFDDSTADFATNVVPVLKQHGFTATQFAVSSWVDTSGHLTSTQLKALAGDGYDIQNHTKTHTDLSTLTYAAAYDEASSADAFITGITGKKPELLAYPYGRYDATAQQALRDVGVKMAFTVSAGKTTPADDFLALNRNLVVSSETMSSFVKKVS
jgi:peptidoglycan/xylan/chitin deacetylase (PgdA/CDA1 family)